MSNGGEKSRLEMEIGKLSAYWWYLKPQNWISLTGVDGEVEGLSPPALEYFEVGERKINHQKRQRSGP